MTNQSFETQFQRLAELSIRFGLNVQPEQEVIITAPIAALDLVRLLSAEAYKVGAKNVLVLYSDDATTLARFEYGHDVAFDYAPAWLYEALGGALKNGAARLAISGDTPGLLANQDPEKVARANKAQSIAVRPFLEAITSNTTNWNIIPFVSPGWAAKVFPDLPEKDAVEKMWNLVFAATRVNQPDPVEAWQENFSELSRRLNILQGLELDALHFLGGGTDLTIGLAKGHKWAGGGMSLENGITYAPNLPTEEVFTMPDRNRAEGRAVFTKPASISGTIVEGLVVDFKGGKAVGIKADKGEDVIRKHLATDEGASHLGEVALVANSSPIAASNTLFFNTLFDENAACHIAFGNAYKMNLLPGVDPDEAGFNTSQIHSDCMIGSAQIAVDGIGKDGKRHPIMREGEFVI